MFSFITNCIWAVIIIPLLYLAYKAGMDKVLVAMFSGPIATMLTLAFGVPLIVLICTLIEKNIKNK